MSQSGPECVACAGSESRIFWSDQTRTIRKCVGCGLLFVFPQPEPETLHQSFQRDYFAANGSGDPIRLKLEFEAWRGPTLEQIVRRIRSLKPSGKLLDVGCASGELFQHLLDDKWELYGIEPSQMAFARARERFGGARQVHLFNDYLDRMSFAANSFDVITMLESLYHMPNPRQELSNVARVLSDDGLLAIAMPGYLYHRVRHTGPFSRTLYGTRCSLTASHLFYFSRKSLVSLLRATGFRLLETVQLGSSSYGTGVSRLARNNYVHMSRVLGGLTSGKLSLAPHVLFLCEKSRVS